MQPRSLTVAHVVANVGGEVAEVEYHSPVSSALLGHAPRREQRVKKDESTQHQYHVVFTAHLAVSRRLARKGIYLVEKIRIQLAIHQEMMDH